MSINRTDKLILNRIQSDFPMTSRPYLALAKELGLDEKTIITSVKKLKQLGIIRRIGGNFSPEKLGFTSTLCAANVPENMIDSFCDAVNAYDGVTHNYQRDHYYNVWFTFIAPTMADIESHLEQIKQKTGLHQILNLPATHVFKIKAQFSV
ncbi:MAG: AsnC Family transcriptional regulator [Candidatus Magnetoglobus multicellularis str. Araruama]|uniref:siroheme decarboxylase n=1 Tax=Candidatus Magnetoglobus multicellularis str. Araruama TaxID=890399 RepID=A0A1V1P9F5_9BACT|nr:MAG: AsnC Family transcriptional regulator [Candidatus Magnetoglobus multicellularis str. Araruama]